MLSEGQRQALEELQRIADEGDSIEISYKEVSNSDLGWPVLVSIDTGFRSSEGGTPLRSREIIFIFIPEEFPWEIPMVCVAHDRWAGHRHVNWGVLCLYLAPDIEWNPSDGMHGFMERLVEWLERAAQDTLAPMAAPVHPPVVLESKDLPTVVPTVNTPIPEDEPWLGFVAVEKPADRMVKLSQWIPLAGEWKSVDVYKASVVLSHLPFPYDFPDSLDGLLSELDKHGLPLKRFLWLLRVTAHYNKRGMPLFVVIGTPMRGLRGVDERQHLAVWHISAENVRKLRNTVSLKGDIKALLSEEGKPPPQMRAWSRDVELSWCPVDEARPEITTRRDEESVMASFAGQTVVLLGCGAIGSHLAEHLTRVGVKRLTLIDRGRVRIGHLSRQAFDHADVGRPKVEALRERLVRIRPELEQKIETQDGDALPLVGEQDGSLWEADIVIDATANTTVAKRFELALRDRDSNPWIMSMLLGHRANRGFLTVAPPTGRGGTSWIRQRTKLACLADPRLRSFAQEFWPDPPRTDLFSPEPGCSSPTFIGSNADVAAVVASLAREAATALCVRKEATATLVDLGGPNEGKTAFSRSLHFSSPTSLRDAVHDYTVNIDPPAMHEIVTSIRRSHRVAAGAETGGLLFGEIDNAARTITVTTAIGPPPDSVASPTGFTCGKEGSRQISDALNNLSQGTHLPIGMWHTHPNGNPNASPTDLKGMMSIVHHDEPPQHQQLLVVVGGRPTGTAWNAYLCDRKTEQWPSATTQPVNSGTPTYGRIGLALSGGGLRAVAFHLGCLRALNDRGLLEQVSVVSGVSAGSLVAALWAYSDMTFSEFDACVMELLRQGLFRRVLGRWLMPSHRLQSTATTLTAGVLSLPNLFLGPGGALTRRTSRTHALRAALEGMLGGRFMGDVARKDLGVVLNACDLRTGSAFRFGNLESGSWRYGAIKDNKVSVAQAVACSAAHPAFFPAMDFTKTFVQRNGHEQTHRVILSDGGLFDNLGTSCLMPGRSARFSTNVHEVDWIIVCDADEGLFEGSERPYWWTGRMRRSIDSMYRRTRSLERGRLFDSVGSPDGLEGFVIAMLGMDDSRLPIPVADLIPRSQVLNYKTRFYALPTDAINKLSGRGEQIMHCLARHYMGQH